MFFIFTFLICRFEPFIARFSPERPFLNIYSTSFVSSVLWPRAKKPCFCLCAIEKYVYFHRKSIFSSFLSHFFILTYYLSLNFLLLTYSLFTLTYYLISSCVFLITIKLLNTGNPSIFGDLRGGCGYALLYRKRGFVKKCVNIVVLANVVLFLHGVQMVKRWFFVVCKGVVMTA